MRNADDTCCTDPACVSSPACGASSFEDRFDRVIRDSGTAGEVESIPDQDSKPVSSSLMARDDAFRP